jgi:hypothetical protein
MFRGIVAAVGGLVGGVAIGWLIGSRLSRDPRDTKPVPVEMAALRSNSSTYAGKVVRVTGKLDQCYAWECSLCPEGMTTANADQRQCLALDFHTLMPGTGFGEEEQEKIFRFASVTLTARFDPSCWKGLCLDRPSVLYGAVVESVQNRRSSRDGLWLGGITPLGDAPQLESAALRAEALKAGFSANPAMKVFSVKGDLKTMVVCSSWGSWPSSLEGAVEAPSTMDFYSCSEFRNVGGSWVPQVQGI